MKSFKSLVESAKASLKESQEAWNVTKANAYGNYFFKEFETSENDLSPDEEDIYTFVNDTLSDADIDPDDFDSFGKAFEKLWYKDHIACTKVLEVLKQHSETKRK